MNRGRLVWRLGCLCCSAPPDTRGAMQAEGGGSRPSLGLAAGSRQGLGLYVPTHVQAPASPSPSRALGPWDRPVAPRLLWAPNPAQGPVSREHGVQAGGDPSRGTHRPSRPRLHPTERVRPLSAALGTGLGVSPGCGRGLALADCLLAGRRWPVLEVLLPRL